VTRDRLMEAMGSAYPNYGFGQHMGYSTPYHLAALSEHGSCPHHRRSFQPVRIALGIESVTVPATLPGLDETMLGNAEG
jgi:ribonuclease HII